MVVARKVWDGNRTAIGARTQSVLLSLIQTCRQQQRLLCAPRPIATAPTVGPNQAIAIEFNGEVQGRPGLLTEGATQVACTNLDRSLSLIW